jgi:hypothetical protein
MSCLWAHTFVLVNLAYNLYASRTENNKSPELHPFPNIAV